MSSFLVTYDLVGTSETSADYQRLIARIKTYHWAKLQKSAWIVRSGKPAIDICNDLLAEMDGNDRVFVGELTGRAAWLNTICTDQWLHDYL